MKKKILFIMLLMAAVAWSSKINAQIFTLHEISCGGDSTGSLIVLPNYGNPPYTYLWNTGATIPVINHLVAGNYSVTVTDVTSITRIYATILFDPDPIDITVDSINNLRCYGNDSGAIYLTVSGGTGTLRYHWEHNGIRLPYTTEDITHLEHGDYIFTVLDDNSCVVIDTFTIDAPQEITFTDSIRPVRCNNGYEGFWQITPHYGSFYESYVAIFSTGDTICTDTVPAPSVGGLCAGNYWAKYTSKLTGCIYTFTLFLEQPLPIVIGLADIVPVVCKGASTGSITLSAIHGGSPGYRYQWSNGMTTNPITNVPAGIYHVRVTDRNNCSVVETYEITEPFEPIKFFATVKPTRCKQSVDGSIALYPEDIYWSPYANSFALYDSLGNLIATVPPGQVISPLPPGRYVGILTSEFGCTAMDSLYVNKGPEDCIKIPNLVTMNGDGYNDIFKTEGACEYDDFFIQIFTDQGVKVFESTNCDFIWDPDDNKAAANTIYYYYIKVIEDGRAWQFKSSINISK